MIVTDNVVVKLPLVNVMVAVPALTPVTVNVPSPLSATVATVSSLDVAVVALTTDVASIALTGSLAIVISLLSPTFSDKVFWLAVIPLAVGGVTLLGLHSHRLPF